MNRKQRRAVAKKARADGMSKPLAKAFSEIVGGTGEHTPRQEIAEGDKVMLNIDAIKARKNYTLMTENYKKFVNDSDGVIFTAHLEREVLVSLVEEPKWLFWCGDLIRVSGIEDDAEAVSEPEEEVSDE